MEPVRGGKLAKLSDSEEAALKAIRPDESAAAWGFRFLQGLPNVTMVLSGMSNMEQMQDNVKTFDAPKPLSSAELEQILNLAEGMKNSVPCTACRYCCAGCPMELDIPMLLATYNEIVCAPSFTTSMRMEALPKGKHPSDCVACGQCTQICPQNIDIPKHLKVFAKTLSKMPSWEEICRQRAEAAARLQAQSQK